MLAPAEPGRLADSLNAEMADRSAEDVVSLVASVFQARAAALSSFGADSAALLQVISKVAPHMPVLFLQTGKHFLETLEYRDTLTRRLGLTQVIDLKPQPLDLRAADPTGTAHERDPDGCCRVRKVRPLERALSGFDVVLTGRRRRQAVTRTTLKVFEADGPRLKVNPLAGWSDEAVDSAIAAARLPRHPLVAEGYASIGCAPCTTPVTAGEDARAGRWRGQGKTECGIHLRPGVAA